MRCYFEEKSCNTSKKTQIDFTYQVHPFGALHHIWVLSTTDNKNTNTKYIIPGFLNGGTSAEPLKNKENKRKSWHIWHNVALPGWFNWEPLYYTILWQWITSSIPFMVHYRDNKVDYPTIKLSALSNQVKTFTQSCIQHWVSRGILWRMDMRSKILTGHRFLSFCQTSRALTHMWYFHR